MQRKGSPPTLSVGILIGAAMVENSMEVLQKTKNRTTYDPTIPLLAIYLETKLQEDIGTPIPQQHYLQQPGHGNNLNV